MTSLRSRKEGHPVTDAEAATLLPLSHPPLTPLNGVGGFRPPPGRTSNGHRDDRDDDGNDSDRNNSKGRRFGVGMLHPRVLLARAAMLAAAVCVLALVHRLEKYGNDPLAGGGRTQQRRQSSSSSTETHGGGGAAAGTKKKKEALSSDRGHGWVPMAPLEPATSLFRDNKKGGKKKNSSQMEKRDKTGKVVYKPITSLRKEDLGGAAAADAVVASTVTYEEAIRGRERLVDILYDAGVEDIDVESILTLPLWSSVTKLYGDGPVVLGLERCEEFRNTIPLDDASIGTAGLFNTGTNPFAMYVEQNCLMPHNTHDRHGGTRWQVPWGKHMLADRKWTNTAGHDNRVNKTNVLPVVLVRDPFSWMASMCRHPYEARWPHSDGMCPNLANRRGRTVPVRVKYKPPAEYESLLHYWAEWYREYLDADYPRLIVRFEDLQFHAKEVIDIVCRCAGAVARQPDGEFTYIVDSAKWGPAHTKSTNNMITAMVKYGTDKNRFTGLTEADKKVVAQVLGDGEFMRLFHYEMPPDIPVPFEFLGE